MCTNLTYNCVLIKYILHRYYMRVLNNELPIKNNQKSVTLNDKMIIFVSEFYIFTYKQGVALILIF